MSRTLSNESSLEILKREAKRWLRAIQKNDAEALARLRRSLTTHTAEPTLREVQHALAVEHGFDGWALLSAAVARIEQTRVELSAACMANAKLQLQERLERTAQTGTDVVARFLTNACKDWREGGGGGGAIQVSLHTASRLLQQHADIAIENIFTAVVCGNVNHARELLQSDNKLASLPGGPRNWPPLLYLASARLLQPEAAEHSVEIAELLLNHGADPNAFYADSDGNRFSTVTCVLGRGEQQIAPQPRERELTALMMERGAEPYDEQALYNVFADHDSRSHLSNDIVWLLQLMHTHSLRLGRGADWEDPAWSMFSMGGYQPAAYHLLKAALDAKLLPLAEWMLQHGAGPDTRPANQRSPRYSLLEETIRSGDDAARALLVKYGANAHLNVSMSAYESFVVASLHGNYARATELFADNPSWRHDPHALLAATRADNADAVTFLLGLGIAPDTEEDRSRARALHAAAFAGATHAAAVLLHAGADPDFRELNYGATPMSIANWAQKPGITDLLTPYSRDVFSLVSEGKVARVREVLLDNPMLAASTHPRNGASLLMCLPDNEDDAVELTKLLLETGADPKHRDFEGVTAMEVAGRRALLRVVAMLNL